MEIDYLPTELETLTPFENEGMSSTILFSFSIEVEGFHSTFYTPYLMLIFIIKHENQADKLIVYKHYSVIQL